MKIIHCADLHLDSSLRTYLSAAQANQRKMELLHTFRKMVEYAREQAVEAVLIAGDLYDTDRVSVVTKNMVRQTIEAYPEITFYYLKGNHDAGVPEKEMDPENVRRFDEGWTTYQQGSSKVRISGMELTPHNRSVAADTLLLEREHINLVMLHANVGEYSGENQIGLRDYRGKGIDYLALGHVHEHRMDVLDARGMYAYSGCLEPRGFDEPGEHGFVVLDIDEEQACVEATFVPFASRCLRTIAVDISDTMTTPEIAERIEEGFRTEAPAATDMVKVVLGGEVSVECEKELELLQKLFEQRCYFLKLYDQSKMKVDYSQFALDASLKGEFVRRVEREDSLNEEEKAAIVRYGMMALAGEEI